MKRLTSVAIALLVALALGGGTTSAKKPVTAFSGHVGVAISLGIGLPAVDIAGASNGDTIELLFTGQIDAKHSKAEGDGGFRHFDKSGELLDFGTFTAKRLISFLDLGPAAGGPPPLHSPPAKNFVPSVGQNRAVRSTHAVRVLFVPTPPPPPRSPQ